MEVLGAALRSGGRGGTYGLCVFSQFLGGVAAQDEKAFLFSFLLRVCSRIPRWMGGRGDRGMGVEGGEGVRVRFAA